MEGRKRSAKEGGGTTCMPRRRGHRRPTPASLLDRLREVVFRLIMLTATSRGRARAAAAREAGRAQGGARTYRSDSYRSEAVEDCIEFFKRSASGEEVMKRAGVGGDAVEVAFRPYQRCEA